MSRELLQQYGLDGRVGEIAESVVGWDEETVYELFEEKWEDDDTFDREMPEEREVKMTLMRVNSEASEKRNLRENKECTIITCGSDIKPFDPDTFVGYGVFIPEDPDLGASKGIIVIEPDVAAEAPNIKGSFAPLQQMFMPFNVLTASVPLSINEEWQNVQGVYRSNVQQDSRLEVESDPDMDVNERREFVKQHVDPVTLDEIGKNLSISNDDGYAADMGADFKVLEDAQIVSVNAVAGTGIYSFLDGTVFDPSELDEKVAGSRGDGVSAFVEPEIFQYGEGTISDVYGAVTMGDDGVRISAVGFDPIDANPVDDETKNAAMSEEEEKSSSGSSTTTKNVSETPL